MTITKFILLFIVTSISGIGAAAEEYQTHRPLIASTLVGFVLGDIKTGIIVGASMELIALGWMTIGASVPPDPAMAGTIAAILAIVGKQNTGVAVSIAIPVAVAGQVLQIAQKSTIDVAIMHWADKFAERGCAKGITAMHFLTAIPSALRVAVPSLMVAYFANVSYVKVILNEIPKPITIGLQIASGFLVVVGYAMIMQLLNVNELLPFFFIGFLIMTFTKMTLVGLAILGASFAAIFYVYFIRDNSKSSIRGRKIRATDEKNPDIDMENETAEVNESVKLERKDLLKVFWRMQFYQISWNYERMQNLCYCYSIIPILKKLYKTKDSLSEALKRHMEYFNTHQFTVPIILGINAAMEEVKANEGKIDGEVITGLKVALMGPLAGLGDPIFWGILRPMTAAIGAGIGLSGNVLGPVIFFVIINAIRLVMRYYGLMIPYYQGINMITSIKDVMPKIMKTVTVLAYTVMGGLVARWTAINVPIQLYSYRTGGKLVIVTVQQQLDAIMPNLLPLLLTFFIYWLLRRKVSPIICIIGLMLLGIIGYTLGVLG
ncbi:mannose/fructose/sorbose PTS transporter subunit IID [Thermoanaerobacterium thermosaccharolyticum]|uniref:mannose/fructose/sorbose PTS transporter subunit IID n=1 Tax=Thermoanaerobacterium thermosaccharolyticum TaxID=1517 RepID=UPI003D286649